LVRSLNINIYFMIKKYSVYFSIFLISILITNCSIKTDLTDKDLEEKFYFKGTAKLFNLDDRKKTLKTFSSYNYNYINSKKKISKRMSKLFINS
jgi:hypothetical protein